MHIPPHVRAYSLPDVSSACSCGCVVPSIFWSGVCCVCVWTVEAFVWTAPTMSRLTFDDEAAHHLRCHGQRTDWRLTGTASSGETLTDSPSEEKNKQTNTQKPKNTKNNKKTQKKGGGGGRKKQAGSATATFPKWACAQAPTPHHARL